MKKKVEEKQKKELELLRKFFLEIARLTLNHSDLNGYAVVYANVLGLRLESVNPKWYEEVSAK